MYIDGFYSIKKNKICVSERLNGKRIEKQLPPSFFYYEENKNGNFISTTGIKCQKIECNTYFEFKNSIKESQSNGYKTFETTIKPLLKTLEKYYKNDVIENPHISFYDIETAYDEKNGGFSEPCDALNAITTISVYNDWEKILYTISIKPIELSDNDASNIIAKFPNSYLCKNENEMLDRFLDLIYDSDILIGYNADLYDLPYIVNRITRLFNENYTRKLCLFGELPDKKEIEKYGEKQQTFNLIGRVQLDYMDLFKKYNQNSLPSYSLNNVGKFVLGETKVAYEGTLDDLFHNDFEKFIEYSRQDVQLMVNMELKLNYIPLVNLMAHESIVQLKDVMGSVVIGDNAILLEAHNRNLVVPDRVSRGESTTIAGAFVAEPIPGIATWVASVDINSLYPSTFRSLNMSPETIIGQIKHTITGPYISNKKENEWDGIFEVFEVTEIFNKTDTILIINFETGDEYSASAKDIWNIIIQNNWILSANGTIFDNSKEGIVSSLLTRWYNDRKSMQKKAKEYKALAKSETNNDKKIEYNDLYSFWNQRQTARKVNLNALYGSLTSSSSKYFDQRLGQSCTLTGRVIDKFMGSKINEMLTGNLMLGETTLYLDTDSCYFTITPVMDRLKNIGYEHNKDNFVKLVDEITDSVNDTFADFLFDTFNVPKERSVIKCGREICAQSVMFVKKKKYACLYYDIEGLRVDKNGSLGELKIMGLEVRRSDTLKIVQQKLEESIRIALETNDLDKIVSYIKEWREDFYKLNPWEQGSPKGVNNVAKFTEKHINKEKGMIPGHVMASIKWNEMIIAYKDKKVPKIRDGSKIVVCKLKGKQNSIAYPIDLQNNLPEWFKELPFDVDSMVDAMVDAKVKNIFGCIGIDMNQIKAGKALSNLFSW